MINRLFHISLLSITMLLYSTYGFNQKVGLVMSGGGAAGMAHVGVIKALEENGIPVDYITGTSAGALVGSYYAIGYSPAQLEALVKSPKMLDMAKGRLENEFTYFFKEKEKVPSIVNFNFDENFTLTKVLPLNVTDPSLIDFSFIENQTIACEMADGNFDSLFIPYRCIASDIDFNAAKVFRKGALSQAVRASMTFPFYLPGAIIDGKIYFDGGLYNNFPADVMYDEFMPDVIIGSSVTGVRNKPKNDDILTQVRSMLQSKSDFTLKCDEGIIINPPVRYSIGTFDFELREEAMQAGYDETMKMMDSIKKLVSRRIDTNYSKRRTNYFKNTRQEIIIDNIEVNGVTKKEEKYIRSVLKDRNRDVSLANLKPRYFKLILDDKIKFIFPVITKNLNNNKYTLSIDVQKKPVYDLRIGGNFSSRSVNTGYVGFDYKLIERYFSITTSANSYFGRFYSSLDLSARIDFPLDLPFYIEPHATLNRWDYYRSFSTFFEDTKPSFLIKNEAFFGGSIGIPAGNNGRIKFNYKNGFLNNEYYQTDQFLSVDTADRTEFYFDHFSAEVEHNTLDGLYLSKRGSQFKASASYITGGEINYAGSTSSLPTDTLTRVGHDYFLFKARFEKYLDVSTKYKLGFELEGVHSTQDFFNNYTSTALISPQYEPTQESRTLFQSDYAAHTYLAGGIKNVIPILPSFDLRLEGYLFQPYRNILSDANKKATYSNSFEETKRHYTLSSALVFNSPIGPAALRVNYMDHRQDKWSFIFNFNYTIFNRKALSW